MDPQAEVHDAAVVPGAAPAVAGAAAADPAEVAEDPIHAVLRTCGITSLIDRSYDLHQCRGSGITSLS